MNRLRHETSPYLLQHAHNPVNWYAWKPEAFELAKAEDKPILASIGYSTCHWCHVMERESFENEAVAAFMNEHFINIKVDREERPDVDQVYMEACQAISGNGGWPLNCFLTPDGRPFFAGTYYPPRPAYNRPSWMQLLEHILGIFRSRRREVEEQADQLTDAIGRSDDVFIKPDWLEAPMEEAFPAGLPVNIYEALQQHSDLKYGGFGGAPKFPAAMALRYLLEHYFFTGRKDALQHVEFSLRQMIMGGIYDQLGGGFARYSTGRDWLVPHFEKMLYDNALLATLMADTYRLTRAPLYKRAIEHTLDFVAREMTSPEGAFFTALDADSEGEEGRFYVWEKAEIDAALGEEAPFFNDYYGVEEGGNWEGRNILHCRQEMEGFAAGHGAGVAEAERRLAASREHLFAVRSRRPRPGLDDKSLLGWNALMATAYARAYAALGHEQYLQAATRNLDFLLGKMKQGHGLALYHTYKDGKAQYDAFLDDYALLIEALLETFQLNFDTRLLEQAGAYADHVIAHFLDPDSKLFYFTTAGQRELPLRRKDLYDSALPSGNSTMAYNLHRLGILRGRKDFDELSANMLKAVRPSVERYPSSFARWARAMQFRAYPFYELAVIGKDATKKAGLITAAFTPNGVLMAAPVADGRFPLLAGKSGGGDTNIYVCKEYACQTPVKTVEEALALMTPIKDRT